MSRNPGTGDPLSDSSASGDMLEPIVLRIALLLACLLCAIARAQTPEVALSGTVFDPKEAGVGRAAVTLKPVAGQRSRSTVTTPSGEFRFDRVAPGAYDVQVLIDKFNPSVTRIQIGPEPPEPLHLVLTLADIPQVVNVTAQLSQVSTAAADNLDTVTLDRSALDSLPILDQDYIATMSRLLDASSVGTSGVTIVVDGVEASRAGVSASAIQEVRINQDPYSAEFPRPGRGRIEIITKPGSPDFHGTINFLFRDYHLNARDPFALERPPEQRRIYEGSLTGPLGRGKKMSFLVSANREEEDSQATVFALASAGPVRATLETPQRNTEISGTFNRAIGDDHLISIRGLYTDRTVRNQGVGGLTLAEAAANFEDREDVLYFNHRGLFSKKWFNQFRFLVARQHTPTTSINPGPRIVVLGAFIGGGAQADRLQTENHIALNEVLVWTGKRHTLRGGINVPDISRRGLDDNTNTAGTYTFSTLQDYQARRPFSLLKQSAATTWSYAGTVCPRLRTRFAC